MGLWISEAECQRAASLTAVWTPAGLSTLNHSPEKALTESSV